MSKEFKVLLREGEDGWIVATVPSLPGCISQGRTEEEALANIKEAIELYLETLEEEYRELTREKKKVKEITVTISK